jgi:ssDNA-binding Zn-finger/Zn-ribbon topoisomerase 1
MTAVNLKLTKGLIMVRCLECKITLSMFIKHAKKGQLYVCDKCPSCAYGLDESDKNVREEMKIRKCHLQLVK